MICIQNPTSTRSCYWVTASNDGRESQKGRKEMQTLESRFMSPAVPAVDNMYTGLWVGKLLNLIPKKKENTGIHSPLTQ